jgi:hypothetical protein
MATLSGVRGQAASKKKPIAPAIDVGRMWVRHGGTAPWRYQASKRLQNQSAAAAFRFLSVVLSIAPDGAVAALDIGRRLD